MKVPPKRKGNRRLRRELGLTAQTLNESPSEKEGKSQPRSLSFARQMTLNESPSEKEGKLRSVAKRAPI